VGLAEDNHLASGRRRCLAGDLEERGHRQQHGCAGICQLMTELARRVQRVRRRAPPAGGEHAVERDSELGEVGHTDAEGVALAEATRRQPGRETVHRARQLGITQRVP
jgi:hypothetical protein